MKAIGWADLCALAALVGCGSSEAPEEIDDDQFAIGEGVAMSSAFSALHDGDPLLLTTDVQTGPHAHGYHVFLQVRCTDVSPGSANLTTKLVQPDAGLVLLSQTNTVGLAPVEKGAQELGHFQGIQVNVCPSTVAGYAMYGSEMRLNLELEIGGIVIESSVMVTPQCPEGDTRCTDNNETGCAAAD